MPSPLTYLLLIHECAKHVNGPLTWECQDYTFQAIYLGLPAPSTSLRSCCDFDTLLLLGVHPKTEELALLSCGKLSNPPNCICFPSISVSLSFSLHCCCSRIGTLSKILRGNSATCFIFEDIQAKRVLLSQQMLNCQFPKSMPFLLFSFFFTAS